MGDNFLRRQIRISCMVYCLQQKPWNSQHNLHSILSNMCYYQWLQHLRPVHGPLSIYSFHVNITHQEDIRLYAKRERWYHFFLKWLGFSCIHQKEHVYYLYNSIERKLTIAYIWEKSSISIFFLQIVNLLMDHP